MLNKKFTRDTKYVPFLLFLLPIDNMKKMIEKENKKKKGMEMGGSD